MLEKVEGRDIDGAVALGKKSKDFVARVLVYALSNRDTSLSNAFIRASNQELARFQQGLATLDTVITAAPLLGLLGTVTGMMGTFGSLGGGGDIASKAAGITGGVAEALIATACGLAIAVSALFPFNYSQCPPRGSPPRGGGRLQRPRIDHQEVGSPIFPPASDAPPASRRPRGQPFD